MKRLERLTLSFASDANLLRVLRLGIRHFRSLVEAIAVLVGMRIALLLFSYRTIATRVTLRDSVRAPDEIQPILKAWSVKQAAKTVPFASCLPQALTLQYLLARLGLNSAVRIGVRVDDADEVDAHAWVIYEDDVLIGGANHDLDSYNVLTDLFPNPAQHA